jgi:sulfatase maturation enzyme AslB (radical SAM superfamily)
MTTPTLLRQASSLAKPAHQVQILETRAAESIPDFDEVLARLGLPLLRAEGIEVLQVNVGKVCNQTCAHCHVDAGPDRREAMNRDTAEACVRVLAESDIPHKSEGTTKDTKSTKEWNKLSNCMIKRAI